ncbi:MAG: metal ABC transporter permease [Chitinophagales bacterium]|nr:metal ABC transporter permease [Chitinophagales bacterium]MCB9020837.1 metal ABC transporter permease [Chitinophagales bacterium]MCB9031245.1 metal ABC transporter permease [Chitinophagales bacterium]HPR30264.1 metal ABC transporter permease [Chitinophagales bacterium]HQU39132.1 metal ABC transporter permease [Chitinophagales bacterium]
MSDAFWIILTGSLVAATSGLLGCFLVLRKMALVGDAISHAVLPGIAIAFLISGSRSSVPMLLGAAAFGLFCTVLIEVFSKRARVQEDAAIGISFTWLFAIGVILITFFADKVDLDQECVLYGEIAFVGFETWLGIPVAVWTLGVLLIFILAMIGLGYKGLFITTFDPEYATTLGISVAGWHYLLMSSVSVTTVFTFESVGAILVVAFLIIPAATAYLLTHKLKTMLLLATLIGITSSILGYYLALWLNASISGSMVVVLGVLFIVALAVSRGKRMQISAFS